jgi:hypothetical protein
MARPLLIRQSLVVLPEDVPIAEIVEWFSGRGYEMTVHEDAPPAPEDRRRLPRELRGGPEFAYWCDLQSSQLTQWWYGGGDSEHAAIRSARKRWRTEQEGNEVTPRQLP